MTNREALERAGLLDPNADLTQSQWDAVDGLSDEEVDSLISVKAKFGPVFHGADDPEPIFLHGILED